MLPESDQRLQFSTCKQGRTYYAGIDEQGRQARWCAETTVAFVLGSDQFRCSNNIGQIRGGTSQSIFAF